LVDSVESTITNQRLNANTPGQSYFI